MSRKFQIKRGQSANLPTLAEGELGFTLDKGELYVGNTNGNVKMARADAVPTKTSQLTNDSGYKTTDNNTTYSLSKSGSTITLTGSDGKTSSVTDADTAYTHPSSHPASMITGLATVATSGSYNDLSNKPTIPTVNNGTLIIQKNGVKVGEFTANQSANAVIDLGIPETATDIGAASTANLGFVRRVSCSSSDGVTYTGTTDGVTALTTGLTIVFVSSKTSASKTPTLNINSLGAKSIKRRLSHLSTSTQEGYSTTWLYANKPYLLVYDGTQWIVEGMTKPSAADLYGTPAAATKATQDGNGNVITDTYATKTSIPTALKNPNALTFTGGATGTYDGSAAKTVNIPTASAVADEVVVFLKDRGDTIVGAVNSNNDITLVSGLADGIYALKYENSDGTKTAIGYLNMSNGTGTVTSYKNTVDASTVELNTRWSNSSYAWTTSSGTGYFATDFIPVTLSTDASKPTVMHFRGATFTGNANIIFYNSSKSVINSATASTNGAGMQVSTTEVTTDENGDYQISLGYKNGAFDSAWTSGVAYMRVGLYVSSATLTANDIKNVIITVDELIED